MLWRDGTEFLLVHSTTSDKRPAAFVYNFFVSGLLTLHNIDDAKDGAQQKLTESSTMLNLICSFVLSFCEKQPHSVQGSRDFTKKGDNNWWFFSLSGWFQNSSVLWGNFQVRKKLWICTKEWSQRSRSVSKLISPLTKDRSSRAAVHAECIHFSQEPEDENPCRVLCCFSTLDRAVLLHWQMTSIWNQWYHTLA